MGNPQWYPLPVSVFDFTDGLGLNYFPYAWVSSVVSMTTFKYLTSDFLAFTSFPYVWVNSVVSMATLFCIKFTDILSSTQFPYQMVIFSGFHHHLLYCIYRPLELKLNFHIKWCF